MMINDENGVEDILNEEKILAEQQKMAEELSRDTLLDDNLLWQARTGLNPDSLCGAIETLIFMSERPLSLLEIRKNIDEEMPLKLIHQSIGRLQQEYEQKHHGLRLLEVAEGYQFRTKATYAKYVQELFKVNSLVLGPTAMEVLAIIAYKQPISKVDVDRMRGVDSSHIVRALMDKKLVKITGRSDDLGKPTLYGTTSEFLEVFNLAHIQDLPPEHELESMLHNQVGKISDIRNLVQHGDKKQFMFDELNALDHLSQEIGSISVDTLFLTSLQKEEKKTANTTDVETNAAPEKRKTAFEILEEFIERKKLAAINTEAAASDLFMPSFPEVLSNWWEGSLNAPDVDDFEMIDLETGSKLEGTFFSLDPKNSDDQSFESFMDDELADLKSDASERLLEEEAQDAEDKELREELDEEEEKWETMTKSAIEKAKDLDLDLDFLGDLPKEDDEKKDDLFADFSSEDWDEIEEKGDFLFSDREEERNKPKKYQ
jgi:segregation and condensation protein B